MRHRSPQRQAAAERHVAEAYELRQLVEVAMREAVADYPEGGDDLDKHEWCRVVAVLLNCIIKRRGAGDPDIIMRRAWRETKKIVDYENKQRLKEAQDVQGAAQRGRPKPGEGHSQPGGGNKRVDTRSDQVDAMGRRGNQQPSTKGRGA